MRQHMSLSDCLVLVLESSKDHSLNDSVLQPQNLGRSCWLQGLTIVSRSSKQQPGYVPQNRAPRLRNFSEPETTTAAVNVVIPRRGTNQPPLACTQIYLLSVWTERLSHSALCNIMFHSRLLGRRGGSRRTGRMRCGRVQRRRCARLSCAACCANRSSWRHVQLRPTLVRHSHRADAKLAREIQNSREWTRAA